ncbi:pyruvate kinase [Neobacillus sp. Marseille-QA0830]
MTLTKQEELIQQIMNIYFHMKQVCEPTIGKYPLKEGAANRDNLLAYLAMLEKFDLLIEQELMKSGLASLKQSHRHMVFSFIQILNRLGIQELPPSQISIVTPAESEAILRKRTEDLFGKRESTLPTSVMVTLDESMIYRPQIMENLLINGMHIARINCAHHDENIWRKFIITLRETEQKLWEEGKNFGRCKVFMDLAGPKLRIGRLKSNGILVVKGDLLRLYLNPDRIGHPATEAEPAGVPVTNEKAFRNVRVGDPAFIDDGKIQGKIQKITAEYIQLEIISPAVRPQKVKEQKGLNLPDSLISLNVPALTEKDLRDLPFVTKYADIVGISFVHSPLDLKKLRDEVERHGAPNLAVVAKIETKDAIHHLARIILEGLHFEKFGIMIARGDLAVEVGLENMSYVQEEILTICSAAFIPVIWATGVLERMTKKGIPARSEMTDAVQGLRAECIMLNKGPYIVESVKLLNKLIRIGNHPNIRKQAPSSKHVDQYGIF